MWSLHFASRSNTSCWCWLQGGPDGSPARAVPLAQPIQLVATVTVDYVTSRDAGLYVCTADNGVGIVTRSIDVSVICEYSVDLHWIYVGSTTSVHISATCLLIRWKDGHAVVWNCLPVQLAQSTQLAMSSDWYTATDSWELLYCWTDRLDSSKLYWTKWILWLLHIVFIPRSFGNVSCWFKVASEFHHVGPDRPNHHQKSII